jgi:gamma-tubulin complex component 2
MKIVNVQGIDQENPDAMLEKYQTPAPSATNDDGKEINGFDALELDYSVPFPLSLVISRKTVLRYQLLFRYTLALRHLESMLVDCWSEHTKVQSWTHKSSSTKIEIWKRRAWTLRARMLIFVQQMLFFATAEVIEPNWQKLMVKVDESETLENEPPHVLDASKPIKIKRTVDELMQDHLDMLDSCMKDLGLTQGKLLKIHAKLMTGCTLFAQYTASLSRSLYAADPDLASVSDHSGKDSSFNVRNTSAAPLSDADPDRLMKMDVTLKRYEEYFSKHLKILIDSLNYFAATETVVLLGLCARLTAAEEKDRDNLI